ncbi:MAG: DNA ligase D [Gemmatimonadales bacterium]|nr:DNA ligase D [Gemmatimonadales bacterium]
MAESEPTPAEQLAAYRAKRSADRTPEPFGGEAVPSAVGGLFVVHKHAARHLHFDFRFEMDGVLKSWAVPKGPSYDQAEKRLAVRVEDHPLEYGDFEGMIPDGNYGAGAVVVWDRGEWVPLEDPRAGLEKGKLLFELKGYKLRGRWTLVKLKKSERDWLLIKERDAWMKAGADDFSQQSVLSGLTTDDLKAGRTPADVLRAELAKLEVPRGVVEPGRVEVMLAEAADEAFTRDGWLFELKLDGYRLIAARRAGEAELFTRSGADYTGVFPEVARATKAMPLDHVVLDGEVVVLDPAGKPSFSLLQKRGRLSKPIEVRRAAIEYPATYFAFDLLGFEDYDLRPLPLAERKRLLRLILPPLGPIRYLDHVEREGQAFLAGVVKMRLEGIIAKKADAPYRGGRTAHWLKIKAEETGDFVIVGLTEPRGGRGGFGALQLADRVDGQLVYAGRVGTGFDDRQLAEYRALLEPLIRATPPCLGPVTERGGTPLDASAIPETRTTTWVEPRLVCEVRYREWTLDGVLRHPAFVRMRDDKTPEQCDRQGWSGTPPEEPVADGGGGGGVDDAPRSEPKAPVEKKVAFSNLKKIFWPAEKYTKGDMIDYYRDIGPWLLPYLKNRPVVLTRFPDGIEGKSFYQKDAPEFAPEWIRTVPIWSEDTQRDIRYFVCDDLETLLYLANSGTIPLHIWASRVGSLELPDWCVIDLDPKEAPFKDVIATALTLHRICEEARLPNYVKTTGKTGLHILIPLGRQCTYEQSRTLGELLARLVMKEHRDISTITRHVTKRGDKVYLDYLQNRHGQLIVSPYSVRPLPGATVSMPLAWDEVSADLDQLRFTFTIKTAVARMEALGHDPVRPVLEEKPDLGAVLERLAAMS